MENLPPHRLILAILREVPPRALLGLLLEMDAIASRKLAEEALKRGHSEAWLVLQVWARLCEKASDRAYGHPQ